jgi:uncharacterized membrane protein YwaF
VIKKHTILEEFLIFWLWKSYMGTNQARLFNKPKNAELISLTSDFVFFDESATAILSDSKIERLVEYLFCRNRFIMNNFFDIRKQV